MERKAAVERGGMERGVFCLNRRLDMPSGVFSLRDRRHRLRFRLILRLPECFFLLHMRVHRRVNCFGARFYSLRMFSLHTQGRAAAFRLTWRLAVPSGMLFTYAARRLRRLRLILCFPACLFPCIRGGGAALLPDPRFPSCFFFHGPVHWSRSGAFASFPLKAGGDAL